MSAIAARLSASVITSQRQSCALAPVGACMASCMHSRISSRATGRVRSRRLRTARVVLSNSSTVAMSMPSFPMCSEVYRAGLVDTQHRQRTPEAKEYRDAEREIEDLLVGERLPQSFEEGVVHRRVVGREAFREFDGQTLPRRVTGVARVGGDVVVELRDRGCRTGVQHGLGAKVCAGDAVVDLGDPHPGKLALVGRQDALLIRAPDHPLDHAAELWPQRPNHGRFAAGPSRHVESGHHELLPGEDNYRVEQTRFSTRLSRSATARNYAYVSPA